LQQFSDESVQPVGFLLDSVQCGIAVPSGSCQLDGHSQSSQRRAQLVRDVQQQPALGGNQILNAFRHLIKCAGKLAQFVAPFGTCTSRKVPLAEALERRLQAAKRRREIPRQPIAQQYHRAQNPELSGRKYPARRCIAGD